MTHIDHTEALVKTLLRHEGLRLKPYKDTRGRWTIGVGRNLSDVGITRKEALHLLANDITVACNQLDMRFPWWRDLCAERQRAMINLCFTLGIGGLSEFTRMLAALKAGKWQTAHDELLDSLYAEQVGDRAKELAQVLLTGKEAA